MADEIYQWLKSSGSHDDTAPSSTESDGSIAFASSSADAPSLASEGVCDCHMTRAVHDFDNAARANEKETFEKTLAEELNQLSIQQRDINYAEIHGVASIIEETPELLQEKLRVLQQALEELPESEKQVYTQAVSTAAGYNYIHSREFGLMFLRASSYDVEATAKRLVLFCKKKAQHFGPGTLHRRLQLQDLTSNTLKSLKGGCVQILPQRDRSGRVLVWDCSTCGPKLYTDPASYLKSVVFILTRCMEEYPESQKRGAVAILWWMHHKLILDPAYDAKARQEVNEMVDWLPLRQYSCLHFCIDSAPETGSHLKQVFARFVSASMTQANRLRMRVHVGTHTENLYTLMTFGIPVDIIPVTSSGVTKTKDWNKWVQRRAAMEKKTKTARVSETTTVDGAESFARRTPFTFSSSESEKIDLPRNEDILLGTGKPLVQHYGNQVFRSKVEEFGNLYNNARTAKEKSTLTWRVVLEIQQSGSRFLKRDENGWWVAATDQEARGKVAKLFVSQSRKGKKGQSENQNRNKGLYRAELPKRIRIDDAFNVSNQESKCFMQL